MKISVFGTELEIYSICLWPNNSWCYTHSVERYMREQGLSDDYEIKKLAVGDHVEDVDSYINHLVFWGCL